MAKSRKKHYQTKESHLIPPKQRAKSRFQNINIISLWWINMIKFLSKNDVDSEIIDNQNTFKWVLRYKKLIIELDEINNWINKIQKLIKTKLLTKETANKAIWIMKEISWDKANFIKNELEKYFEETLNMLEWKQGILLTSDIIESSFWKYKNYLSDNPMSWITDLSLSIPAFTSNLDKNEIKQAFESTTYEKMKKWVKDNIWDSLLKLRRYNFIWYWNGIKKVV